MKHPNGIRARAATLKGWARLDRSVYDDPDQREFLTRKIPTEIISGILRA